MTWHYPLKLPTLPPLEEDELEVMQIALDIFERRVTATQADAMERLRAKIKNVRRLGRVPVLIGKVDCYAILSDQAWDNGEMQRLRRSIREGLAEMGLSETGEPE